MENKKQQQQQKNLNLFIFYFITSWGTDTSTDNWHDKQSVTASFKNDTYVHDVQNNHHTMFHYKFCIGKLFRLCHIVHMNHHMTIL